MPLTGFPPPWILALWALFASTLNASLGWLQDRLLLAAVLGALSGRHPTGRGCASGR